MSEVINDKLKNYLLSVISMIEGTRRERFSLKFEQFKTILNNLSDNSTKCVEVTNNCSALLQKFLDLLEKKYHEKAIDDYLGYTLVLWFTHSTLKKFEPVIKEYWHLLIKFTPRTIDTFCLSQLLNISFSSNALSWISSKILTNILNSSESRRFANAILSLALRNNNYFKNFDEIIKANKDFTNSNYIIEIINKLNESSTNLIKNLIAQSSVISNDINEFPYNTLSGDYEIVNFLQQTNKIFTNLYQLQFVSNSDKTICSSKLENSYSFIQVVESVMILWVTNSKSKLAPSFIRLKNLVKYQITDFCTINLQLTATTKPQVSVVLDDRGIANDMLRIELKRTENCTSFERILSKYAKNKVRKVSICNSPLMFISKVGELLLQENSETPVKNSTTEKVQDINTMRPSESKRPIQYTISSDSFEVPGNQLAVSSTDEKKKQETLSKLESSLMNSNKGFSVNERRSSDDASYVLPSKYIEVMRKDSKKYGKKRRSITRIKDIWEITSSDSAASNLPTPSKNLRGSTINSIIPNSLSSFVPLENNDPKSCEKRPARIPENDSYESENDSPLITFAKRRKKNIIFPTLQSQSQYSPPDSLNLSNFSKKGELSINVNSTGDVYSSQDHIPKIKGESRNNENMLGNSTTIVENSTTIQHSDVQEPSTAKTTFTDGEPLSESYDLMCKGVDLFSLNILHKIKTLEEFILNKEREMRNQLELDFRNIHNAYNEDIKRLHEYFIKESETISRSLK